MSFFDGFEDGDISEWSTPNNGGTGTTSSIVAEGSYSADIHCDSGNNESIDRSITQKEYSSISFYQRIGVKSYYEDTHISFWDANNNLLLRSHLTCTGSGCGSNNGMPGQLVVNNVDTGISYSQDNWYFIELNNIDYQNEEVGEVVVDGNTVLTNVSFYTSGGVIDRIQLRTFGTTTFGGYYDSIELIEADQPGSVIETSTGVKITDSAAVVKTDP